MNHSDLLSRIRVITTREETERLSEEMQQFDPICVDSEWYDVDEDKKGPANNGLAFSWQFAWRDQDGEMQVAYVHNYGESDGNIHALTGFFKNESVRKVCHNAPVDWHMAANHGIWAKAMCYDTMVADFLLDENRENRHGLKECAEDFLGHERASFAETFFEVKLRQDGQPYASGQRIKRSLPEYVDGTSPPSVEEAMAAARDGDEMAQRWLTLYEYACADSYDGLLLWEYYEKELSKLPWIPGKSMWDFFLTSECHLTDIIMRMERRGMYLDLDFLKIMAEHAESDLENLKAEILEWAGCPMNIGSKPQLAKLLYGVGRHPVMKGKKKVLYEIEGRGWPVLRLTPGGDPSTQADHLKELQRHLVKTGTPEEELSGLNKILLWNTREKQRNTYLLGLQEAAINHRVHGRFNQIGATSGRFSSSNPNLQNITTGDKDIYHIRDAFCAPPGYLLIVADFSQLEYRLLAHFSQEPKLIDMFNNGWDLHSLTCWNIYPHIQAEALERFGKLCTEALDWIKDTYPDERKRAKCVHPDTLIATNDGYRTIGDVVGTGVYDTFTEPTSTHVDTPTGLLPINSGYVGGDKELVTVVTRHNIVVCTPVHKFRLTDGRMIPASELEEGMVLEEAIEMPLTSKENGWLPMKLWEGVPETQQPCTPDLAYFAGVFQGDGTNNESSAAITHGPTDQPKYAVWQEQLMELCRSIGLAPEAKDRLVYLGSRVVVRWLEALGLAQPGGKRKKMSVPAWAMTQELFPSYFAGLADTDGCVGKDGRLSVTTKWPTYAGQLITLLRACGVQCSAEACWNVTYQRYYYRIFLAKADGYRFQHEHLRLAHKRARLANGSKQGPRPNVVTHVIPYGLAPCVDLNVRGHVYNANALVTHNTLNFEIIYGVGYAKLADQLRISEDEGKRMINGWFRGYPYVTAWFEKIVAQARSGQPLRTLAGRYRRPNMRRMNHSERGIRGEEERTLKNAVIQGSASDVTKRAMQKLDKSEELKELGYCMIAQVHDEIVGEIPRRNADKAIGVIRPLMENPWSKPLRVPLPVSAMAAPTWSTAK